MKRTLAVLLAILFLTGCSLKQSEMDSALDLRNQLLTDGYTCDVTVTAEYLEKKYTFAMHCSVKQDGKLLFKVISPDTIAGITGNVSAEGGQFTFDDKALLFETVADGRITPVTSPWLVFKGLRSGYIRGCEKYRNGMLVQLNDSYEENAYQIDVLTDAHNIPISAEIYWQGRRILLLQIENFKFL